jgi:hypothetical protein
VSCFLQDLVENWYKSFDVKDPAIAGSFFISPISKFYPGVGYVIRISMGGFISVRQ